MLNYLNAVGGDQAHKSLMKYVYNHIEDRSESKKITGLIVFESLLEFSER